MKNFGKYLANLSALETLTEKELRSVSLAISEQIGKGLMRGMVLDVNIRPSSTMSKTFIFNASVAMVLKGATKLSTKKKLKKGTAKEPGTGLSSKAVKSAKGANLKLKSWKNTTRKK